MFCPHCGTQNDAGNRFCVSCGSSLSEQPGGKSDISRSPRQRFASLVGETKRARLLTAGTVIAIAVAAIAFIALKPSDDHSEDAFLRQVDKTCVTEKERISNLERETLRETPPNIDEFASVLVTIVAEWRATLNEAPPPAIHRAEIEELDSALREVLIGAGGLARVTREGGSPTAIGAQAAAVDAATTGADRTIDALDLNSCSKLTVGPAA